MKPASQEQVNQSAVQQQLKSLYHAGHKIETRQEANPSPDNGKLAASGIAANEASEIGPNDVLLGRGGQTNQHNIRYREIVASYQAVYLRARKRDKITIANRIVAIVHGRGGRFLKRDGDNWVVVSDKKAQEKTSQALREGLDVRNNKVRPNKQIRRDADSIAKAKLAHGKVITATATADNEPPLAEEPPLPEPTFAPYERQISQSDIRDACEI